MSDEHALGRVEPGQVAPAADLRDVAGAADRAAAEGALARYRQAKAAQTLRAQDADLQRWAAYLAEVRERRRLDPQADRAALAELARPWATAPTAWAPVTWGLVEGFLRWQEREGYSLASISRALSTVRAYAKQAARAGALAPEALKLIETVETPGPRSKEGRNADARRERTRRGAKKAAAIELTPEQARALRGEHPDTPQGRRDALLMCLLLEHGLRVSEVAGLTVGSIDVGRGRLSFYRPKVHLWQTIELSRAARAAAAAYYGAGDALPLDGSPLLRRSDRRGELGAAGMSTRGIAARVAHLGQQRAHVAGLSPHDCRHFWASFAQGDVFTLQEAGGWSSLEMPRRYHRRKAIANQGLRAPGDSEL
jgi:integrase